MICDKEYFKNMYVQQAATPVLERERHFHFYTRA